MHNQVFLWIPLVKNQFWRKVALWILYSVEGLYCKRPIQCLASSKIFTPTPSPPGERVRVPPPPPPLVRGEDPLAGWRRGGGSIFLKTPDTALYSTCKYFVLNRLRTPNYVLLYTERAQTDDFYVQATEAPGPGARAHTEGHDAQHDSTRLPYSGINETVSKDCGWIIVN